MNGSDSGDEMTLKVVARVQATGFPTKFGVPRQSGLAPSLTARVVFEPAFRNPDALRGLEGFSHLWLIWGFSQARREDWSPTIRPPRLGGNKRVGVFASRSPFRPNALALSSVKLEAIRYDVPDAPVLLISGADLLEGTPIYDIKPYLAYTDAHPEAVDGFAATVCKKTLQVQFADNCLQLLPEHLHQSLCEVLTQDPRPSYQHDENRIYGFIFSGYEVKFRVLEERFIEVLEILKI